MLAAAPETETCWYFPRKALYLTADEASVALRDVARIHMDRGRFDPRLRAFPCGEHYHLGRTK